MCLQGLAPGTYRCKFIVDGRWCVDMAAPTENDGRGNVNNVIHILEDSDSTPALDSTAKCTDEEQCEECKAAMRLEEAEAVCAAAVPAAGADCGLLPESSSGVGSAAKGSSSSLGQGRDSQALLLSAAASIGGGSRSPDRVVEIAEAGSSGDKESMPRVGAVLLAFYCKLTAQRRTPSGQR